MLHLSCKRTHKVVLNFCYFIEIVEYAAKPYIVLLHIQLYKILPATSVVTISRQILLFQKKGITAMKPHISPSLLHCCTQFANITNQSSL